MSTRGRNLILSVLGLMFTGCSSAPVETFDAKDRPAQTATILEADGAACQLINNYIIGTDPKVKFPNSTPNTPFIVPAGSVKMVVGYHELNRGGGGGAGFNVTITKPWTAVPKQFAFIAEAGHTYTFVTHYGLRLGWDMEMNYDQWDLDVIDKETKAIVFATHDRDHATTQKAN